MIASVVVPLAERFQRVREFREEFRRFRIFPEFCDGRGIAKEIVAEKGARPRRKIRQQPYARPQQIHGFREPRVVAPVGTRSGAGRPLRFPEAAAP